MKEELKLVKMTRGRLESSVYTPERIGPGSRPVSHAFSSPQNPKGTLEGREMLPCASRRPSSSAGTDRVLVGQTMATRGAGG